MLINMVNKKYWKKLFKILDSSGIRIVRKNAIKYDLKMEI